MSDSDDTNRGSAPPTPEAHGNREERGSGAEAQASEVQADSAAEADAQPDESPEQEGIDEVRAMIEALLLASDDPLDRKTLEKCMPEVDAELIKRAVETLRLEFSGTHRGMHLAEVAGGFQLRTNPDYKDTILRMYEARPRKLSRAAMETLAIIAYQQPLTRADVEEIRGVDSSGVIRTLEEHDLVKTIGRLDDLGRPHIYGTTERFLEFFGLDSLADLPTLDESELESIEEMYAEELEEAERADAADVGEAGDTSGAGEDAADQE